MTTPLIFTEVRWTIFTRVCAAGGSGLAGPSRCRMSPAQPGNCSSANRPGETKHLPLESAHIWGSGKAPTQLVVGSWTAAGRTGGPVSTGGPELRLGAACTAGNAACRRCDAVAASINPAKRRRCRGRITPSWHRFTSQAQPQGPLGDAEQGQPGGGAAPRPEEKGSVIQDKKSETSPVSARSRERRRLDGPAHVSRYCWKQWLGLGFVFLFICRSSAQTSAAPVATGDPSVLPN